METKQYVEKAIPSFIIGESTDNEEYVVSLAPPRTVFHVSADRPTENTKICWEINGMPIFGEYELPEIDSEETPEPDQVYIIPTIDLSSPSDWPENVVKKQLYMKNLLQSVIKFMGQIEEMDEQNENEKAEEFVKTAEKFAKMTGGKAIES